jgi:hypothetical protein
VQTFPVPALRASFDLSTEFGVSLALALQPHPLSPWRRRVCLALRLAAPLVIPVEKKKAHRQELPDGLRQMGRRQLREVRDEV